MKVAIINCFDTYEDRIDLLHDFFINNGHEVTVIQSDFRHFKKIKRIEKKQDFIFVQTKPYYKNMCVGRMVSHYRFAKMAFQIVSNLQPDLLYVIVPPNSLAKFAAKHKRKYRNVKLIFDLVDLWPEALPIGKVKVIIPFYIWKRMRDKSLKHADFVITECNLYQTTLKKVLEGIKSETVYLAKREVNTDSNPVLNKDEIHLCYLGSINNIIDIPKIKSLVKIINNIKPVTFHIIGDGENKDVFVNEIENTGAVVKYYGDIYDFQRKQDIFDKCQFGINIMKDTVCVGLTMKSIDYFQAGLPIINSIKADTAAIVDKYKTGINVIGNNMDDVAAKVANYEIEEIATMRKNAYKVFKNLFSLQAFFHKLKKIEEWIQ